jgi:hypothetical protein
VAVDSTSGEREMAKLEALPLNTMGDEGHLAARIGISALPLIGGPILELFNRLVSPPLQRRRDAWLNELNERLFVLEQKGALNIEELSRNDQFISTMMGATTVALKNHRKEKLDALRNAVINSAISPLMDDWKGALFLSLVDSLSVWHLKILDGFRKRDERDKPLFRVKLGIPEIINIAYESFPDLRTSQVPVELFVEDLCRYGLVTWSQNGRNVYITQEMGQVTPLGYEFLKFIGEPP